MNEYIYPRPAAAIAGAILTFAIIAYTSHPGGGLGTPAATIGNTIDDTVISTRVKTALLGDADIDSNDIKVTSSAGSVQLSGFVSSQAKIDKAMRIAGAVEGAASVRNEMRIKH